MHYVSLTARGPSCTLQIHDDYPMPSAHWVHILNPNYLDDTKEILAAMASYEHTNNDGVYYVDCNYTKLTHIVEHIINAQVISSVPMLFLAAGVRRAMITFGCAHRWLPRDILREIDKHVRGDEDQTLVDLFNHYIHLKDIAGLYVMASVGGVSARSVRVVSVVLRAVYFEPRVRSTSFIMSVGKGRRLDCVHHLGCAACPTPHFCTGTHDKNVAYTLKFKAADEITFKHKSLHKRVFC